jgi:hypothetical protein
MYFTINKIRSKNSSALIKDTDQITVDVEVQHDNAVADGDSAITATVAVSENGVPRNGVLVYLSLIGSEDARFRNGTTEATARTQQNGGAEFDSDGTTPPVAFTDTLAETGLVAGYIKLETGDNPGDQKPFMFVQEEADALDLVLENNGAAADNVFDAVTARAKVTHEGRPVRGATVNFQLVPNRTSAGFSTPVQPVKLNRISGAYAGQRYGVTGTATPGSTVTVGQRGGDGDDVVVKVNSDGTFSTAQKFTAGLTGISGVDSPECRGGRTGGWNDVYANYSFPLPTITPGGQLTSGKSNKDGIVEAHIQDPKVETGTVESWIVLTDENKIFARKDFQFTDKRGPDGYSDSFRFPVCPKV